MTFKGLLVCAVAVLVLLPAASAFGQSSGGGAAAPPSEAVSEPPVAEAAQDPTPTTPEGEEQPSEEEENGDTPTEENGGPVVDLPLDGAAPGTESAGEALPRSGFEAYALGAIGLGLLLAGAALRPTRSWPPPRDRLSRSTPHR